MLKKLLCNISEEKINKIKFNPYGLDTKWISGRNQNRTSFWHHATQSQQVEDILSDSVYFTEMEPTKKKMTEGKHMLATTERNLYSVQQDVDKLPGNYYNKKQTFENQYITFRRRKQHLVYNHFSVYAATLNTKKKTRSKLLYSLFYSPSA